MENAPIILPVFFYLLQVLDELKLVTIIFFSLSVAIAFIIAIVEFYTFLDDEESKIISLFSKWLKRSLVATIISLVLLVFLPTKKTIIAMVIAKNITPQNIENAQNVIKSSIDYVFEKINSLESTKENK